MRRDPLGDPCPATVLGKGGHPGGFLQALLQLHGGQDECVGAGENLWVE